MSRFISITDDSGAPVSVEPELVVGLYPYPGNPAQTIIELSDGSTRLSNDSVATLTALFTGAVTVSGTVTITDGSGPITVDGTVAATQSGPWTVSTGAQKTEDSAHTTGDTGNFVLAVRNDAGTSLVDATLDYAPLQVNSVGELRVTTSGGASTGRDDTDDQAVVATGLPTNVVRNYVFDGTNWDRQRSGSVTGMAGVAGAEAHDAPVTGNPVLQAGRASNVAPTDVSADGDVTRVWTTRGGRQRVYASGRRRLGVYYTTFTSTVTAAADGALVGRGWLVNNTGSTVFGAFRQVMFTVTSTTGLLTPTAPTFTVERITFTGTPSGAQLTPCKRDSTDATNTLTWRTASTGMTITAGAALAGLQVGGSLLATNMMSPMQYWPLFQDEDGYITLRAGEGVVIRQATAGTAADTRAANFEVAWEEFNSTDFTVRD